jgi:hypothetical protein
VRTPVNQLSLSGVSTRDAALSTRAAVAQVSPRGTRDHVAQSGTRRQAESLSVGGSSPPMVTTPARGAIGRRSTFRPCRSGFESPRADQLGGHVRPRSQKPGVAELAHATASRAVERSMPRLRPCGFESHRRDHSSRGHSRRARRRVVSAGVRVRVPLSSPWARRSTGGSVACNHGMRVRSPPSPPRTLAGSSKGRAPVLQTGDGGSIPSPATTSMVSEGKRCAGRL